MHDFYGYKYYLCPGCYRLKTKYIQCCTKTVCFSPMVPNRYQGPRHGHGAEGALFWGSRGTAPGGGLGGEALGKFSGL